MKRIDGLTRLDLISAERTAVNETYPTELPQAQFPAQFHYEPQKRPRGLLIAVVILSVLLVASTSFLAVRLWQNSQGCGPNMTTGSKGECVPKQRCPDGYYWGYGGNPIDMTPEEIEEASSCLREGVAYKPVIYLYPTQETEVSVSLSHPENFTVSYPEYETGWRVIAQPNGDLMEVGTGRELYSLYYESRNEVSATMMSDGFVIPGDQAAQFLEEKLPRLGLNPHESEEFIIYWLPVLQQNPWNYIRFQTLDEMNANQLLTVTPQPDTMIRVHMSYKPLDQPIEITEQTLPQTQSRDGFVVVEWGGTEITGS